MTKYNLTSVPMVHTPGLVRAARATAPHFEHDRTYWLRVFVEGYSLPADAATALIMGEVEYTLTDEGKTVTFEHGAE